MSEEYVRVAKASEVAADSLRAVEVQSESVCLANVGGKIYAIGDACTHEQCSLSEGLLEGKIVECLCHGSQFDVTTGKVVRGPASEAEPVYEVNVQNDEVYVKPSGVLR